MKHTTYVTNKKVLRCAQADPDIYVKLKKKLKKKNREFQGERKKNKNDP
jgi:hypothetical protein